MSEQVAPDALAGASGAEMPIHAIADGVSLLFDRCAPRQYPESADDGLRLVAVLCGRCRIPAAPRHDCGRRADRLDQGGGMMHIQIRYLMRAYGLTEAQALVLAAPIWGTGQ